MYCPPPKVLDVYQEESHITERIGPKVSRWRLIWDIQSFNYFESSPNPWLYRTVIRIEFLSWLANMMSWKTNQTNNDLFLWLVTVDSETTYKPRTPKFSSPWHIWETNKKPQRKRWRWHLCDLQRKSLILSPFVSLGFSAQICLWYHMVNQGQGSPPMIWKALSWWNKLKLNDIKLNVPLSSAKISFKTQIVILSLYVEV